MKQTLEDLIAEFIEEYQPSVNTVYYDDEFDVYYMVLNEEFGTKTLKIDDKYLPVVNTFIHYYGNDSQSTE